RLTSCSLFPYTTLFRSSVNRVCNAFRAALNLAADNAKGAISRAAWEIGLKAIPNSTETRNVVLPESHIRRLILEAPKESEEFGRSEEHTSVLQSLTNIV